MERKSESGFTFVEALIAIVLVSFVAIVVFQALTSSARLQAEISVEHELLAGAERGLSVLASDVRNTSAATEQSAIALTRGGAGVRFRRNLGFDASTNRPIWSEPIEYAFETAPGELENGADDNGNGLIDEARLVRIEPSGERATIVENVAPGARFLLETSGERMTLRASFEVRRAVTEREGIVVRRRPVTFAAQLPN
jgi:type II secretory pathway pseudopilin PulG